MKPKKSEIIELIFDAIEELNQLNGTEIMKDANTVLVGSGSELDSMDFIQLIVAIETKMIETFHLLVSITAEKAMSQKHSPFRTVDTLADYILELIKI